MEHDYCLLNMHGNVMDNLQRFYTYGGFLKPTLVRFWTSFVRFSHSQGALVLVKSFSFRYTCVIVRRLYATRELSYPLLINTGGGCWWWEAEGGESNVRGEWWKKRVGEATDYIVVGLLRG